MHFSVGGFRDSNHLVSFQSVQSVLVPELGTLVMSA